MSEQTLRERTSGFAVTGAQACARKMNLKLGSDLMPIIDCANRAALHGPPIEFLEQELKRMHDCVHKSLLEATAWMGIPDAKRNKFIAGHMENADFILERALEQIRAARGDK